MAIKQELLSAGLSTKDFLLQFRELLLDMLGEEWEEAKKIKFTSYDISCQIKDKEQQLKTLTEQEVNTSYNKICAEHTERNIGLREVNKHNEQLKSKCYKYLDKINEWGPQQLSNKYLKLHVQNAIKDFLIYMPDQFPFAGNIYANTEPAEVVQRRCEKLKRELDMLNEQYPLVVKLEAAMQPYYDMLEKELKALK